VIKLTITLLRNAPQQVIR